jgi:hypothetical protein
MRAFGTIEGPVGVWRQLGTTPYREGDPLSGRRVLCGALSRLEPGAGKLARRVLRGGVSREARPLPDYVPSLRSPWRAAADAPLHEVADDAAVGVLVVDVPEAETPTQTSSDLRLRASYFYPDRAFPDIVRKAIRQAYTRAGLPHARAYRPAKSPAPRSPPRSFSNPNARAWPSVWRSWRRHRDRGSGGREVVVIAQRSRNRAVTDKDQKTRWGKRIAQRYLGANALGSSSLPAPGQAASASRFRPFAAFAGAGGLRAAEADPKQTLYLGRENVRSGAKADVAPRRFCRPSARGESL